ncbi:MAG: hypothetical protein AAF403_08410 [Pseudomonadota bacterium]
MIDNALNVKECKKLYNRLRSRVTIDYNPLRILAINVRRTIQLGLLKVFLGIFVQVEQSEVIANRLLSHHKPAMKICHHPAKGQVAPDITHYNRHGDNAQIQKGACRESKD